MAPDQVMRFAVGSVDGPRSPTWRLWVPANKSDIYISRRSLAGEFKASLHESGKWRMGFTAEHEERPGSLVSPGADRAVLKWDRPEPIVDHVTKAFSIVVPWFELRDNVPRLAAKDEVALIPAPSEKHCAELTLFLVEKGVALRGWPGQRSMGTSLVGTASLANGGGVCLVAWMHEMNRDQLGRLNEFRTRVRVKSKDDDIVENVGALLVGVDDDGTGWLIDVRLDDGQVLLDGIGANTELVARGEGMPETHRSAAELGGDNG
jgi:hypothetical protein